MAHHTLTLNYSSNGDFQPDKDVLPVNTGDTISFQLGTAPPNSKFKITANDPAFFTPAESSDSSTKVRVVEAVSATFRCQLFDADGKILNRAGQAGLHVEPDV
jgi:hypothetical protein